jgi:hypothetical protein
MSEKVARIREGGVFVLAWLMDIGLGRLIVEDDNLIDAEDSEGAGDSACEGSLLIVRLRVGDDASWESDAESGEPAASGCEDSTGLRGVEVIAVGFSLSFLEYVSICFVHE